MHGHSPPLDVSTCKKTATSESEATGMPWRIRCMPCCEQKAEFRAGKEKNNIAYDLLSIRIRRF